MRGVRGELKSRRASTLSRHCRRPCESYVAAAHLAPATAPSRSSATPSRSSSPRSPSALPRPSVVQILSRSRSPGWLEGNEQCKLQSRRYSVQTTGRALRARRAHESQLLQEESRGILEDRDGDAPLLPQSSLAALELRLAVRAAPLARADERDRDRALRPPGRPCRPPSRPPFRAPGSP